MNPSAPSDSRSVPLVDGGQQHTRIPARLPQQTFEEAKTVAIAIANGRLGRRWVDVEGEVALRHAVPQAALQVKLSGNPLLGLLGLPITVESLQAQVHELEPVAVVLLHVVIGTILDAGRRPELRLT